MRIQETIQAAIHKMEVGGGARHLRVAALVVAVVALAAVYDMRAYRDFSAPEAMDSAQLARNIAEGKGYTTQFIRPLSLYLVQRHNESRNPGAAANTNSDFAQIKTAHPDLANPPVYPLALAALMKALPFQFTVETKKSFWSENGGFMRYQPEFLIGVFNEILLLAVAALTFLLARKLFDSNAAWLSAVMVLGCEQLWHFSASGLSTILVLVIFMCLTLCLVRIEKEAREPQPSSNSLLLASIAAGALVGIGALTRYAFGWTIIPVALFLILFTGQRRLLHMLAAFGAFAIFLIPWIVRNEIVGGTAFGTAGFAILEGTIVFPKFQLERSIHPELSHALWLTPYIQKLAGNLREIFADDLPKLGGSWASLLFLTGLLFGFRGLAARRIRYFLLMCLGMFVIVQALGRTSLSDESPEINSENLLVLLAPLAFIYGAGFFFTLLDQMTLPLPQLRHAVTGGFAVLCCLPLIFALLPPKPWPVNFPPYYPPKIQEAAHYMQPEDLMMSDVPWAVAWYGDRQCVWLTLDWQNDFHAIHDGMKPVNALYLSPKTMDGKFVSEWMEGSGRSWGNFLYQALDEKRVPDGFPLTKAPDGYFPENMFLADRKRW